MTLGQRIKLRRQQLGLPRVRIAKVADVSVQAISQWETDQTKPSRESIEKIAPLLKVSADWLLTGEEDGRNLLLPRASQSGNGLVAEIDVRLGAGGGGIPTIVYETDAQGSIIETEAIKSRWSLPYQVLDQMLRAGPEHIRIFEVIGDSMEPRFFEGDRIFIDVRYRTPSPEGIFALWDGIGVVIKRIQVMRHTEPLQLKIISANPQYDAYEVNFDEINIIGRYAGRFTVN